MKKIVFLVMGLSLNALFAQNQITYYQHTTTGKRIYSVHEVIENSNGGYDIYCLKDGLLPSAVVHFDGTSTWTRNTQVNGSGYVDSKGMVDLGNGTFQLADATYDGSAFSVWRYKNCDWIEKGLDGKVYTWDRNDGGATRDSIYQLKSNGYWKGFNISALKGHKIEDIFVTQSGVIHFATDTGLAILNQGILSFINSATDTSFHFDDLYAVHVMADGTIVVGTRFLGFAHNAGGSWVFHDYTKGFREVSRIVEGSNGNLWMAKRDLDYNVGIVEVDLNGNISRGIVDSTANDTIFEDAIIRELFVDSGGDVWVGLYQRSKLVRFTPGPSTIGVLETAVSTIEVYPNPSHDYLKINLPAGTQLLGMYSTVGQLVAVKYAGADTLDVRHLASGVYVLQFSDGQMKRVSIQ